MNLILADKTTEALPARLTSHLFSVLDMPIMKAVTYAGRWREADSSTEVKLCPANRALRPECELCGFLHSSTATKAAELTSRSSTCIFA